MPYFLSTTNISLHQPIQFSEEELRHLLLSRRIKVGEQVLVQGPDGKRFRAVVKGLQKKSAEIIATEPVAVPPEPQTKVALLQAMVAEKALDFILQKGTELGVAEIVLWNSENTATRISETTFLKKQERWTKILWEAAKQSERSRIPALKFLPGIAGLVGYAKSADILIVLDASANQAIADYVPKKNIVVCIGPEGGLTTSEIAHLVAAGGVSARMGQIVLRAETAALAAIAVCVNA